MSFKAKASAAAKAEVCDKLLGSTANCVNLSLFFLSMFLSYIYI